MHKELVSSIFKNVNSWQLFKNEFECFYQYDFSEIGRKFEVFTKYYFLLEKSFCNDFKNIWLYKEVPLNIQEYLNITSQDYGIDLVLEDYNGKYYVVQCKYRKDENSSLSWSKDKIANLFAYGAKADYFIVFSNASCLDSISKSRTDKFQFISIADLLNLEADFFKDVYKYIENGFKNNHIKFCPRGHQQDAILKSKEYFSKHDRGQLILPCGAGKTLTALWIKEALNSQATLVLVPSLALLKQIKNEWKSQANDYFDYLCVCSDKDINTDDDINTHSYDIDVKVSTNPNDISLFLGRNINKIIFSTYQSLDKVATAIKDLELRFDLTICDEAHRTAGVGTNNFTMVHKDKKIPSLKRLYMTATPRVASTTIRNRAKSNEEIYLYDMDDAKTFGFEIHRMSFKEAIDRNILVDYKILAVGVSDEEIYRFIKKRRFVENELSIDEIANNYALDFVMNKYNLNHAITFHSRIRSAKSFTDFHSKLFHETESFHISSKYNAIEKTKLLDSFRKANKAVVSNARCLTEGVDVPSIDIVYFSDNKNSKIDIVQACGRALRKYKDKKLGYIVIPIFHYKKEELNQEIDASVFNNLIQVVKSLCDQDERLQEEINNIAYGKNLKREGSKHLEVDMSEINNIVTLENFSSKVLERNIFDQVIERNSNNWDLMFLKLKDWLDKNDNYPSKNDDEMLYGWISIQRTRFSDNKLERSKIKKLESINFVFNKQDYKWNQNFNELVEWKKENPQPYKWPTQKRGERDEVAERENSLAVWQNANRKLFRDGTLSDERLQKLQSIGFIFDAHQEKWDLKYQEIIAYIENHDRWLDINNKKEAKFVAWINSNSNKKLTSKQNNKFDKLLGMQEKYKDLSLGSLEKGLEKLKQFIQENNRLPASTARQAGDERKLYAWMTLRRLAYRNNELNDGQIQALYEAGLEEFLNTEIERRDKKSFDDWLFDLENFYNENQRWPRYNTGDDQEKALGFWLSNQRNWFKGNLKNYSEYSQENHIKLKNIGYDLDDSPKNRNSFEESLEKFKRFYETNQRLPSPKENKTLYNWINNTKSQINRSLLSKDNIALIKPFLNVIGEGKEVKSQSERVAELREFVLENNRLPKVKENDSLYQFIARLRAKFKKSILSKQEIDEINNISSDILGVYGELF
ncbi:DEAD/DEAH box helicase [Francisella philomiragia]|uniref:DEAD/DEAH box helicase n=1 Tax=Francisella philomiragia TaxID=28110 RepID=UPI001B8BE8F6|nr:DEAD/DEAH box helicase [Francisella philomiragia]QUE31621.1 Helicase associated domain protein [Francisella philomiragia]